MGAGVGLGEGVGLGDGVGIGEGVGMGVGVGLGETVVTGVGLGETVGTGVGLGVGLADGGKLAGPLEGCRVERVVITAELAIWPHWSSSQLEFLSCPPIWMHSHCSIM
jgi:hypothetical protein